LANQSVEGNKRSKSQPRDGKENDTKIDTLHILITALSQDGSLSKIPVHGHDMDRELASTLVWSSPNPKLQAGTLATECEFLFGATRRSLRIHS
jgi:hypothetical protein